MMAGSKRHYLFCVDLCTLFGADGSRPNAETWEAMSLEEQQAFVLQIANDFSVKLVNTFVAPPAVTPELIASNNAYLESIGVEPFAHATPEELGAKVDSDGEARVVPALSDIENTPLEPVNTVSLPEVSTEPNAPVVSSGEADVPATPVELPVDGDLGSVPQN